jgi:hypothetical protein
MPAGYMVARTGTGSSAKSSVEPQFVELVKHESTYGARKQPAHSRSRKTVLVAGGVSRYRIVGNRKQAAIV